MSSSAARSPRPEASQDFHPETNSHETSGRETSRTACFSVHARAEPGIMPRVLELFAKRGLVPSSWHSATGGPVVDGQQSELTIDIEIIMAPPDIKISRRESGDCFDCEKAKMMQPISISTMSATRPCP